MISNPLRIALVTTVFPPDCNSGAVQLRDLTRQLVRQGHYVCVLMPSADIEDRWLLEELDGIRTLRLKAPRTRDIGYVRRTIGECLMPFVMLKNLRHSPLAKEKWDGVAWYSPSIFLAPFVSVLKRASRCKGYLIIRDIFPQWALDMGLMGRGLPYLFFDLVARYQYAVADVIGVQTAGNLCYFDAWKSQDGKRLEVLQNWLGKAAGDCCPIRVQQTSLAGRNVLVYAGNMGVAQGVGIFLALAERMMCRSDVGFLFVGRGSEVQSLKNIAQSRNLTNILFFDEIHPNQIPDLYAQCQIGLVALDPRHKSHNIPGKFLTYMQCGLPVLANVNAGNDLVAMIRKEMVGEVCELNRLDELVEFANRLLVQIKSDSALSERCRNLFEREFSVERAASQIVKSLQSQ